MKKIRWLALGLLTVAGLVSLLPGVFYVVAIAHVDDRPVPADPSSYSPQAIEAAWRDCHEQVPVAVDVRNPWEYVLSFVELDLANRPKGERAAGRIALSHNRRANPRIKPLWWHASGAALSIWISRNWSAQQIGATLVRDSLCQRQSRSGTALNTTP